MKLESKSLMRAAVTGGVLLMGLLPLSAMADCGKVTIGELNWDSARMVANVEKFILQAGYGCKVEIIPTTTVPSMASLIEKGDMDLLSETWLNSIKEPVEKGLKEGKIVDAGRVLSDGGVEAWWIPQYLADAHPEIKTIADVKKNWKLFEDPESPGKGRFHNCPAGWGCQIINSNLFKAYGMGDTFVNFDPGSAEGLNGSIAKAFVRKQPWVGYYWAPTAILGKYPMKKIGLNASDPAGHACNQKKDCDKPHAGSYPPSVVLSLTTIGFKKTHPKEYAFISKIGLPNDVVNAVLAWGEGEQAKGEELAAYFMAKHKDLWKSWLPADIAAKVEGAL